MIKRLPVIVQLYDKDVKKADLLKELRIDQFGLERQLARQPGLYCYWAELYATVSGKVAKLREELEHLEAVLYTRFTAENSSSRIADIKHHVLLNPRYRKLQRKLRLWEGAERHLRFAEKAFDQRLHCLQSLSANQRREKGMS